MMDNNTHTSEEEETESRQSERLHLHKKIDAKEKVFFIRSKSVLTILTRLVSLVMTLSSAGVITTSIWLMVDCRKNFARVRPMIPGNTPFCTNMGMPALFACCTILFTIFGLGCTGRRLTGYALIIISSVEILQGVTTLTFYKCNTLTNQEVLKAVNTTLLSCQSSTAANVMPFALGLNLVRTTSKSPLLTKIKQKGNGALTATWGENQLARDKRSRKKANHFTKTQKQRKDLPAYSIRNTLPTKVTYTKRLRQKRSLLRRLRVNEPDLENLRHKTTPKDLQGSKTHISDCSHSSLYFIHLSLTLKKDAMNKCLQVCKSFQTICQRPQTQLSYNLHDSAQVLKTDSLANAAINTNAETVGKVHTFESNVLECGEIVSALVDNLCFYDNKVIIPLSLCAPVFYIIMSMFFIYFAHCDRLIKSESHSVFMKVPSKQCTWRILLSCTACDFHHEKCFRLCKRSTGSLWEDLTCCSHCARLLPQSISSYYSNSTHELLQLSSIPSNGSNSVILDAD